MSESLQGRWKAGSAWYAARPRREKLILGLAALAVTWALLDALWLSPATRAHQAQRDALRQKESELVQLTAQRAELEASIRAREVELRRDTDLTRVQLSEISGQLAEFEKALVPARQMPDFLRSLLPGAGVEIVALRTLAPTPLIVRPPRPEGAAKEAPGKVGEPTANIYKHGLEITLAGNYDALLAYLSRLEQSPQKVLWGRLELRAEKHPRNELVLMLYTLSLDPSWLVV